jgi:ubiquinone/menaquinone biosynthesis C-methylase UbiE
MNLKKDFTKYQEEYYKTRASKYDNRNIFYNRENRSHFKKIDKVIDFVIKQKPENILEIGVGTGIHASKLLTSCKHKISYVGIDVSKEMLSIARKRIEGIRKGNSVKLLVSDMHNLPFKDSSFDLVYCVATLHHSNDPDKAVLEMKRVLKKGGRLILIEPNRLFPTNFVLASLDKAERNVFKMSMSNFEKWTNDLKDVDIYNFNYTPPFPKLLFRLYDLLDKWFEKLPIIRYFSVMYFVTGTK